VASTSPTSPVSPGGASSSGDSDADVVGAATAGVRELSYEQARDELIRVVNELEQGSSTLEQSLALWERGEALARRCEEWLIGAKARLDAARSASLPAVDPGA
jgi:exodeoxyribonuclease VII small subunit